MNVNVFNILIISGVVHGFIFSFVVLLGKKYRTKSSPYLALVALFLSIHNLYYWILDFGLNKSIPLYDHTYIPWNLLILPTYYFFVQDYFGTERKNSFYYLAPFFISLIIHFSLLADTLLSKNPREGYTTFEVIFYYSEEYFSLIFTVFVIVKTFQLIKREEQEHQKSKERIFLETSWLKKLLFIGIFICFLWLCLTGYSQINHTGQFNTNFRYILWLSISILIYWLGYLGVYHGLIFKQRIELYKRVKNKEVNILLEKNSKIEQVKTLIEKEKLFLDASLNINKISNILGMSESYFSTIFNQNSSDGFSTYLNKLRISEAKKLLLNREYEGYTIIAVGLESGFNSKSAFYRVFKEHTGITPSEFKKRNMS